jgi:hypothetical protein
LTKTDRKVEDISTSSDLSYKKTIKTQTLEVNTIFQWKAYPAKERARSAITGGLIILFLAVTILLVFKSWILALLSIFVLVLRLNRFYFPSSFSIDSEGISAKYLLNTQYMNWNDVKRIVNDENGAYLSERTISSRWDAFRGMHILFGNDSDKVRSLLKTGFISAQ